MRAILSDHDRNELAAARATLDALREPALSEEQLEVTAAEFGADELARAGDARSNQSSREDRSLDTELTSISDGLDTIALSEKQNSSQDGEAPVTGDLTELDEATKLQILLRLFQEQLPAHTIKFTLRDCEANVDAAIERLLNLVYFREASDADIQTPTRGIDAFSEDHMVRSHHKGKGKGKKQRHHRQQLSRGSDDITGGSLATNRWQTNSQDINFIADRINLPLSSVSSTYHANGASLPRTIMAVMKDFAKPNSSDAFGNEELQSQANDLQADFPALSHEHAIALLQMAYPSRAAAHELAEALRQKPANGGIQIVPQYASTLDTISSEPPSPPRTLGSASSRALINSSASSRLGDYSSRSNQALMQAISAHRLAKSNPLMAGAAAYYAQERREYSRLAIQALADVADTTAAKQSSPSQLDLHNIDVANAVRIAQAKVQEWWSDLGESRVNGRPGASEREMGYSIIVGKGTHSQGGKPKVGPAVSKMLREQGWKFEATGGVLVVKGRAFR